MDVKILEKNKFELNIWKVALKTSNEFSSGDELLEKDINILEQNKFDSNWNIRIITEI